ncbi:MAG: electron transfer flavoprotein subunit beta/FixA family protein [Gemmatimonadota bacterium]
MNIVVCVKRVPDTETRVRVAQDGTDIDPSGVKFVVSPYDEFALEAALRAKEAGVDATVTALSLGDAATAETLRQALAMGADQAVLLEGAAGADGLAVAKALAAELEGRQDELVLFGIKAIDDDQQQVGPMVGTLLGRPCATSVSSFEVDGAVVRCRREVEGGTETVELPLPAVVSMTKGPHEPRYPSLKGIMAAKKKPLEQKAVEVAPPRLTVASMTLPPERPAGRIVGEGPDAVPELVRLLRDEAKVL